MQLERYEFSSHTKALSTEYQFESVGPKGIIKKSVLFGKVSDELYNLVLGDVDEATDELDDTVTSNNKDGEKVLATVAAIVMTFTNLHPAAMIYAEGSTAARTRLYQICITKHSNEIFMHYEILGLVANAWERFRPNRSYTAFLAKRRK